jgi:uncharacterized repeat protein (TIGR03943 family)
MMGAIATIWLAATGRLTLYIHPRYVTFTLTVAVLALGVMIAAIVTAAGPHATREHRHADVEAQRSSRGALRRLGAWSNGAVLVCTAVALLVIPPATLSAKARQDRALVTSGRAVDSTNAVPLAGADPATFSVKDWAALMRQGGPGAVLGKQVDLSGYVLDRGEEDTFFVVRMTVSCCAVDAQPIGVPVRRPGWRAELRPGDWISLQGVFTKNPSRESNQPVAIRVASLTTIAEPSQPYVF